MAFRYNQHVYQTSRLHYSCGVTSKDRVTNRVEIWILI